MVSPVINRNKNLKQLSQITNTFSIDILKQNYKYGIGIIITKVESKY